MTFLERAWYKRAKWLYLLAPVSLLYRLLISLRRRSQQASAERSKVPVIIVGNIAVGGTGKTPLLICLVEHLKKQGYKPGVVSRGYGAGADAEDYPLSVEPDMAAARTGDEPLLIATRCQCPVVIDPRRPQAVEYLLENFKVDIILSDDGLQHYRLPRDLEIAVVDGSRLFGNGLCLPAGPLREPVSRLREVGLIVVNGEPESRPEAIAEAFCMRLKPTYLRSLGGAARLPFKGAPFKMGQAIQGVAAIGNPERFFDMLRELPYEIDVFPFPDHSELSRENLEAAGVNLDKAIVMTEKDGIKCREFAASHWWVLEYAVDLPPAFFSEIDRHLARLAA